MSGPIIMIVSSFMGDLKHSGGVARHARLLAAALKGLGYSPVLVTRRTRGSVGAYLASAPKAFNWVVPGAGTVFWAYTAPFFQKWLMSAGLPVDAGRVAGYVFEDPYGFLPEYRPHLLFIHALESLSMQRKDSVNQWACRQLGTMEKKAFLRADKIAAVSEEYARLIRAEMQADCPPGKLIVIPAGFDFDGYVAGYNENKSLGQNNGPLQLLAVGHLNRIKNHLFLLEVVKGLKERGLDVFLSIVGDGPEYSVLLRLIQQNGLEHCVSLKGFCDPRPYYSAAHILLLPSLHETFGLVLLEARSFKLVNLVSDLCHVPRELYDHRLPLQPGVWVDCIAGYYHRRDRLRAVGEAGCAGAKKSFSLLEMGQAVLKELGIAEGPAGNAGNLAK